MVADASLLTGGESNLSSDIDDAQEWDWRLSWRWLFDVRSLKHSSGRSDTFCVRPYFSPLQTWIQHCILRTWQGIFGWTNGWRHPSSLFSNRSLVVCRCVYIYMSCLHLWIQWTYNEVRSLRPYRIQFPTPDKLCVCGKGVELSGNLHCVSYDPLQRTLYLKLSFLFSGWTTVVGQVNVSSLLRFRNHTQTHHTR